jgi:hypothetical protein
MHPMAVPNCANRQPGQPTSLLLTSLGLTTSLAMSLPASAQATLTTMRVGRHASVAAIDNNTYVDDRGEARKTGPNRFGALRISA